MILVAAQVHQRLLPLLVVLIFPNLRASIGYQLTATNYCILQNLDRNSSDSSMQEFVIFFYEFGMFCWRCEKAKRLKSCIYSRASATA